FRRGAGSGQIAEVHRRGPEPEVAPGDPVEPEVDPLDEGVLGDEEAVCPLCRVVVDPGGEPAPCELLEQAKLADVGELHDRLTFSTSTGPAPAPISHNPFPTA